MMQTLLGSFFSVPIKSVRNSSRKEVMTFSVLRLLPFTSKHRCSARSCSVSFSVSLAVGLYPVFFFYSVISHLPRFCSLFLSPSGAYLKMQIVPQHTRPGVESWFYLKRGLERERQNNQRMRDRDYQYAFERTVCCACVFSFKSSIKDVHVRMNPLWGQHVSLFCRQSLSALMCTRALPIFIA